MRATAWAMIWDKYDRLKEVADIKEFGGVRYKTIRPAGYKCDCDNHDEYSNCPLHDRHNGYYRRLQRRLTRYLLASYQHMPANFREANKGSINEQE